MLTHAIDCAEHSGAEEPRVRITALPQDFETVPDVRGMGLKDALFLMEQRRLRDSFTGTGAVREQSLAPNSRAVAGRTVRLTLR